MTLDELKQNTKEADDLARSILHSLYKIAAAEKGYKLTSIKIYKVGEEPDGTVAPSE